MKSLYAILICCLVFWACGKEGTKPAPAPSAEIILGKAVLLAPVKDEVCTKGTIVSATESNVRFDWQDADKAESYDLVLKNLTTQETKTLNVTASEMNIGIKRGEAFSWYIVSKSTKANKTESSETWKFYNAGIGVQSYAPFPAETVAPFNAQNITATSNKVSLKWTGSDVDNDIVNYDIYFGDLPSPPLLKKQHVEGIYTDIPVVSKTVYYWKIVTYDSKLNSSTSDIFSFKVE